MSITTPINFGDNPCNPCCPPIDCTSCATWSGLPTIDPGTPVYYARLTVAGCAGVSGNVGMMGPTTLTFRGDPNAKEWVGTVALTARFSMQVVVFCYNNGTTFIRKVFFSAVDQREPSCGMNANDMPEIACADKHSFFESVVDYAVNCLPPHGTGGDGHNWPNIPDDSCGDDPCPDFCSTTLTIDFSLIPF